MAKTHTIYICQQCGAQTPKYGGRCTDCGAWNSLVETVIAAEPAGNGHKRAGGGVKVAPTPLSQVQSSDNLRIPTGIGEFDRVLGGGVVPGSIVLLGGEPGIGKSTLLTQAAALTGTEKRPTLYISAEESPQQIKLRAERLGITGDSMHLFA